MQQNPIGELLHHLLQEVFTGGEQVNLECDPAQGSIPALERPCSIQDTLADVEDKIVPGRAF